VTEATEAASMVRPHRALDPVAEDFVDAVEQDR
jgi:hypothetical protein